MGKNYFAQLKEWIKTFATKRRILIGVAIIVAIGILVSVGVLPWRRLFITGDPNMIDGRNAYDIGLLRAREWHADALMDRIDSGAIGDVGRAKQWNITFVSGEVKGTGLVVEVVDRKVVSAVEIPYVGTGADFPVETISQQEAIRRVRLMKGYENEPILGVEAVYGPAGQVWYWGVRTAKGIVSVQAK